MTTALHIGGYILAGFAGGALALVAGVFVAILSNRRDPSKWDND